MTPRFDLLNTWANFLDDLPSDRFHMPAWGSKDATRVSCGSAGCAGGWAATVFNHLGLQLEIADQVNLDGACYAIPCYKGEQGYGAIARFFQISPEMSCYITMQFRGYTDEYGVTPDKITPRHAADRIRKVIVKLGGTVVTDYPIPSRELVTT